MQRCSMDKQGRVTIPGPVRKQMDIAPGMEFMAEVSSKGLLLRPVQEIHTGFSPLACLSSPQEGEFDARLLIPSQETRDMTDELTIQAESVVSVAPLDPSERRRIFSRLAG